MKKNQLSKNLYGKLLSRWGKTAAIAMVAMLAQNSLSAQTIFANPVGIGVGTIAPGKNLHVNGPIRFGSLVGVGTRIVTCDPNGDLGFTTIPPGTVAPGTSIGQSLLWNGTAWTNNDFLKVPAFTGAPKVFEVGRPEPIDFLRTIHYGGNVALDLFPGTLGSPSGVWMSQGWRQVANSNPAGDNFMGTRINWQDYAANIGLTDRIGGGAERDLNVQFQDFTVPAASDPTNRLIFSSVTGPTGGLFTREYATILGNGNMGVGTPNPLVKFEVENGNIAQVSAGALAPPSAGNRWSALGDRIPFAGGPGIISTGLRTQWDEAALNVGLTDDPTGTVPRSGLISWQDATSVGTGNNSLIFGARDNTNTNFFERMRITWDGHVGIGTDAPLVKLQVQDGNIAQVSQGTLGPPSGGNRWCAVGDRQPFTGAPGIISTGLRAQWDDFAANFGLTKDGVTGTLAGLISWQDAITGVGVGKNPLLFGARDVTNTNFFERMRITWDGNVGIGTTNATDRLTVAGNVVPDPIGFPVYDLGINSPSDTWRDVYGVNPYTSTSDARYKKDVTNISYGLEHVMKLRPVSYVWKEDRAYNGTRLGFISQEVMEVLPEVVVKPTTDKGAYMMRYSEIIPVLVSAIQEQQKQIEALTPENQNTKIEAISKENAELKARLEKLEGQLSGICSLPCVQEAIKQNTQEGTLNDQPQLFQNEPNPFGSSTTIKYYVPANAKAAQLKVVDNGGKQLATYTLKTGKGQLEISAGTIPAGTYNYSLYVDNQVIDTKKMVIVNY